MKILREYQKTARDFLLSTGFGGCLFMEMRLGKTLTAIRALKRILWKKKDAKILIVGPNSTHKGWIEDLADEGFTPVHIFGSAAQKEKKLATPANFYLINKEGYQKGKRVEDKKTKKMITKWEPLDGIITDWDAVVLDESHFIKNPQAGVSKFFLKNFNNVPFKICLTGTPFENNELDFVQQYLFILGDNAPFDYWKFRAVFTRKVGFNFYLNQNGRKQLDTMASVLAYSLRRKDVNMDKEKIFEVRTVEMPPAARKVYRQVEEEFVLEYKNERRITKFIVEQFSIMRRICGGFIPRKDEDGNKLPPDLVHQAKVKELFTILDENFRDEPVVIFAQYHAELDLIEEHLTKKGFKCGKIDGRVPKGKPRWRIENKFKKGKFDKLIVQPHAVKEGVDLSVADVSIYYSLPAGYIVWKQTQDRILSLAKDGSLLLIILEVENSLEVDMWKKIENKTTKEDLILSALHEKIEKK